MRKRVFVPPPTHPSPRPPHTHACRPGLSDDSVLVSAWLVLLRLLRGLLPQLPTFPAADLFAKVRR